MAVRSITSDPDIGIPDLVRRLGDDSKRLMADEVRLAKLEARDSMQRVTHGVLWLAVAFGASVVMFVALTVFVATLIGRIVNGHMWLGALITGIIELAAGGLLIRKGFVALTEPSWSFEASRASLADTANWATSLRNGDVT